MPRYTSVDQFEKIANPTEAEKDLIAACRDGYLCELGEGSRPTCESDSRTIRADLLAMLITGGSPACGLSPFGVQLRGAYISGILRLSHCKSNGNTLLVNCHFQDEPCFDLARFQRLSLAGSHLPGLYAPSMHVKGAAFLRDLTATGTVSVNGAKIGGQFDCERAKLDGAGGKALNAQGLDVRESLFLTSLTAIGTVDVNGATVGGQLACENIKLDGKGAMALNAQRMIVKSGLIWRGVRLTQGQVYLAAAHVGDLVDDRASWPIGAHELFLDGFTYDRISAASTNARDRLPWLKAGSTNQGTFYPQPYNQLAKVLSDMGHEPDARDIRMAARHDAAAHARSLDRDTRKTARAFRKLSGKPHALAFASLELQISKEQNSLIEQTNRLMKHFALFHFPSPTTSNAPEPVSEITRAYAQQDFRNQMWSMATKARLRIGWSWISDQFLLRVVGYGYAPMRSLWSLLGLFAIATFFAHMAWTKDAFAPNSDVIITSSDWANLLTIDCIGPLPDGHIDPCVANPADAWSSKDAPGMDWDTFNRYGYAADLVIPILDLGQTDAWAPSKDRGPWGHALWWLRWVLAGAGWIVTGLGAAAVTGIIKRDRG